MLLSGNSVAIWLHKCMYTSTPRLTKQTSSISVIDLFLCCWVITSYSSLSCCYRHGWLPEKPTCIQQYFASYSTPCKARTVISLTKQLCLCFWGDWLNHSFSSLDLISQPLLIVMFIVLFYSLFFHPPRFYSVIVWFTILNVSYLLTQRFYVSDVFTYCCVHHVAPNLSL